MTRRRGRKSTSAIYAYAESLRQEMLDEYREVQEAEYARAAHVTHGRMLNQSDEARLLGTWYVFTGPPNVLRAYASRELLDYLADHPRTTRTAFERQWLEARVGLVVPPVGTGSARYA